MAPRRLRLLRSRRLADGSRVFEAAGFRARLLGLAGLASLPPAHALLLHRCRSVHTFGMRFPVALVFLDASGDVVRVDEHLGRWRAVRCRAARSVVEANAGEGRRFAEILRGQM